MYDERMPTIIVIVVPIRTYHGQAIVLTGVSAEVSDGNAAMNCLAKTMNAMTAIATAIPVIASRWIARRHKIPRKNPPSSPPCVNDAIESATTTIGIFGFCGKSRAPPVSAMPQASAKILLVLRTDGSLAALPGQRQIDVVHRRRGQRVDRAGVGAHRRRENRRQQQADQAVRHVVDDERREDRVGAREGHALVQHPEPDADHQEEQELEDDDDAAADDRDLAVLAASSTTGAAARSADRRRATPSTGTRRRSGPRTPCAAGRSRCRSRRCEACRPPARAVSRIVLHPPVTAWPMSTSAEMPPMR